MLRLYLTHKRKNNRLTFCNEGGSRSSKTWDAFNFILDIISVSTTPLEVHVYRETLVKCKAATFKDFKGVLGLRGGRDKAEIFAEHQSPRVKVGESTISFFGLDGAASSEGMKSDIVFFNEALSGLNKEQYSNIIMRCEALVIMDWNPRFSKHWVFDLETQPNVFFTRTTFRDNQHLSPAVRDSILAYEPTLENIANGTADEYRWKVYGLGVRAAQEGLVFNSVEWINQFPDDVQTTMLGLDFGFTTDPTALVKVAFKPPNNLYLQELLYTPISDPEMLYKAVAPHFDKVAYNRCYCDSADKYAKSDDAMVDTLLRHGLPAFKTKKYAGSVMDGIMHLKRCKIHIVNSPHFELEVNNYVWQKINGIETGQPIDDFNHLWDAARYAVLAEIKDLIITTEHIY